MVSYKIICIFAIFYLIRVLKKIQNNKLQQNKLTEIDDPMDANYVNVYETDDLTFNDSAEIFPMSITDETGQTTSITVSEPTGQIASETENKNTDRANNRSANETTSQTNNESTTSSKHNHKKGCDTSHLRCHLGACLKFQTLSNSKTQQIFGPQPKKGPYTKDSIRNDLTDMIVWDELSFQVVEGHRDIIKAYNKRKVLIKEILQNVESKISLTCDAWTSLQQLEYLAVTTHFLDKDWNIISILLSFPLISYPHTGLQTITLNNATSNNVAIHELADCISQNSFININEDLFHNHTLIAAANSYPTLNNALASIWNIHTHLLSMKSHPNNFVRETSQAMIKKFNKYWEQNGLLHTIASRQTQINKNGSLCEVNRYLDEPIAMKDINILEWWKHNKGWFPNLSAMAQDFLAIPATSITSEQMFSCAGRIIDDNRASLDPNTIAALICQKNWLDVAEKF
ncbi:21445_t:CDS:2, partial [Racocetra persica]